jgi:hypothetical protein
MQLREKYNYCYLNFQMSLTPSHPIYDHLESWHIAVLQAQKTDLIINKGILSVH